MNSEVANECKQSIYSQISFLKSSQNIQQAFFRAIPIGEKGFLVPLSQFHQEAQPFLQTLARWQKKKLEESKDWIKSYVLDSDKRIIFLVVNSSGEENGYIGFTLHLDDKCFFEISDVWKEEGKDVFFSEAMMCILEWARKTLYVNGFYSEANSSETSDFCMKNGFIKDENRLLYKTQKKVGASMILTAGPSISAKEAVYAYDAALYGWNSQWSKYLTLFEKKFAEYVGVKYAMATSSCTGALQIALMALDIGPGDEVIVPDQTWVATANAVRYVGAIPVFADIELDSWGLDPHSVSKLITNKTKAIMPVHMYGHPVRMSSIIKIAQEHGLKIIEDAAPAIGAEWQGKRCGSFGQFGAFSFQGAKLMVTGEGGMLVTDDEALYKKALKIWDQGRNPSRTFWIDGHGVKFKMSNVQAAVGLAQLERVDEMIEMKRRVFGWYEKGLEKCPFVTLNKEVDGARSIYWMSSLRLDEKAPLTRDELMKLLKERNVDTRPVFPAISQYPIWPRQQSPQPTALRVGNQAINLPSGVCLTKDEIDYVCDSIRGLLER